MALWGSPMHLSPSLNCKSPKNPQVSVLFIWVNTTQNIDPASESRQNPTGCGLTPVPTCPDSNSVMMERNHQIQTNSQWSQLWPVFGQLLHVGKKKIMDLLLWNKASSSCPHTHSASYLVWIIILATSKHFGSKSGWTFQWLFLTEWKCLRTNQSWVG